MNNQSRTKENPLIHATPEIKTSQKQNKSHYLLLYLEICKIIILYVKYVKYFTS